MANFYGRLYGHFEILQGKIGQEIQDLSHFETLKDFEPSICSIFQGAKKGAFNQNQVLLIAPGDGPLWS